MSYKWIFAGLVSLLIWSITSPLRAAQNVKRLSDVNVGMSKDDVLSGLQGNYELQMLIGASQLLPTETWSASPKTSDLGDRGGIIGFTSDKVFAVRQTVSEHAGDAVAMSRQLFRALWPLAQPEATPKDPTSPDGLVARIGALMGIQRRVLDNGITLENGKAQAGGNGTETETIILPISTTDNLVIEISLPDRGQPYVTLDRSRR